MVKWMVYFIENPLKMDDWGVPLFQETSIHHCKVVPPLISLFINHSKYRSGGFKHLFIFHFIYGMSSFPLTIIVFRGVGQPPTRDIFTITLW